MEKEILKEGLAQLKIEPSDAVIDKFTLYLQELKKWNRAYNLTALKKDKDIIIKHFLDSLLYLKFIPEYRQKVCDIGSGAGFPGVPISIVRPDLEITLIEPSRKKTAFLRHIKRILSLENIIIMETRVEDLKMQFDIGVTRALFDIRDLIKKASHILKENGFFIINKGPKIREEIMTIHEDVKIEVLSVMLPLTTMKRNIIKVSIPKKQNELMTGQTCRC